MYNKLQVYLVTHTKSNHSNNLKNMCYKKISMTLKVKKESKVKIYTILKVIQCLSFQILTIKKIYHQL